MSDYRNKGYEANNGQTAFDLGASEKYNTENLVMQAINRNTDAFGQLYLIFVEKIYRYVFYHINNKTAAEDITGEVFLKAWRAIDSCRGKEKAFSAWLYRIAHNQMVDEIRRRQRRPSIELANIETVSDSKGSVEDYSEHQELLRFINRLPSNQKQVIILKFIEGMETREIAKIIGKSEGAIRILQMRGLSTLKKELDRE